MLSSHSFVTNLISSFFFNVSSLWEYLARYPNYCINRNIRQGIVFFFDRLCGLVVRVLGYRSGGPGSIPGTTRNKVVGLERGSLSLVSTTEK
jgi:hypothetical protein